MERLQIDKQLKSLPSKPGVYLFKNERGEVLYVGKASKLRNRVRSYFQSQGQSLKNRLMIPQIADYEFIVTDSDLEALILECNFIKRHRPKYNVRLRDDKNYPYLRISLDETWPRVYITRRYERDGARYFGPFASSKSVRRTLDLLKKLFPYRSCKRPLTGTDKRPCLDYHIHRCLGPCIGAIGREEYFSVIQQVCLFLEGKQEQIIKQLREEMNKAAGSLQFERAAFLRDQLRAIEMVVEHQRVLSTAMHDQDVIALARNDGEACVQVFFIRGGKLIGREHFVLEGTQDEDARRIMGSFVMQFYDRAADIPPRLLLQSELDEPKVIDEWLRNKRGDKVVIRVPRKGEGKKLVDLVAENAAEALEQLRAQWLADEQKTRLAVEEIARYLKLPALPKRIECYDISNIRGTSAVGSMVVFERGQPKKSEYRRFQIKTVPGANDYAMLQEVLQRRFKRAVKASRSLEPDSQTTLIPDKTDWGILPDLVIVDGGKGQLHAALDAMKELNISTVPIVAIAKEHEELFTPDCVEPITLPPTAQGLYFIQRIRDEAHRFALSYHQAMRKRTTFSSLLGEIPGVGPKRKAALLKHFGTIDAIREASITEISRLPGLNRSVAENIKCYL
ncbi:MAG: excinuclease ABC subunit UvrC [Chloroflexi bacterium]|nr:excinuclease ABC subunit UvrC [Chloroflexota bacterium]MCL5076431.1 excinuclease ABC subunit UvrC [Chloroflexota bacterium]